MLIQCSAVSIVLGVLCFCLSGTEGAQPEVEGKSKAAIKPDSSLPVKRRGHAQQQSANLGEGKSPNGDGGGKGKSSDSSIDSASTQESHSFLLSSEIQLADQLLSRSVDSKRNLIVCPIGIHRTLRLLQLAAEGTTREQLTSLLGVDDVPVEIDRHLTDQLGNPIGFSLPFLLKKHPGGAGVVVSSAVPEYLELNSGALIQGDVITHVNRAPLNEPKDVSVFVQRALGRIVLTIEGKKQPVELQLKPMRQNVPVGEKTFLMTSLLLVRKGITPSSHYLKQFHRIGNTAYTPNAFADDTDWEKDAKFNLAQISGGRHLFEPSEVPVTGANGAPALFVLLTQAGFDLNWLRPFVDVREKEPFHTFSGPRPTQYLRRISRYNYMANEHVQLIEIPFANGVTRFRIWLPNEKSGNEFLAGVLNESVNKKKLLSLLVPEVVELIVPEFKIESRIDFEQLSSMLDISMLTSQDAKLSGISKQAVLGQLFQQSDLNFNNVGVSVKSKTIAVGIPRGAPRNPILMTVNRPFLFEIVDMDDVVLFNGRITHPMENTQFDNIQKKKRGLAR